jgi:hypothetical protein
MSQLVKQHINTNQQCAKHVNKHYYCFPVAPFFFFNEPRVLMTYSYWHACLSWFSYPTRLALLAEERTANEDIAPAKITSLLNMPDHKRRFLKNRPRIMSSATSFVHHVANNSEFRKGWRQTHPPPIHACPFWSCLAHHDQLHTTLVDKREISSGDAFHAFNPRLCNGMSIWSKANGNLSAPRCGGGWHAVSSHNQVQLCLMVYYRNAGYTNTSMYGSRMVSHLRSRPIQSQWLKPLVGIGRKGRCPTKVSLVLISWLPMDYIRCETLTDVVEVLNKPVGKISLYKDSRVFR